MVAVNIRTTMVGRWSTGTWLGEMATIGFSSVPIGFAGIDQTLIPFDATASGGSGSWGSGTYTQGFDGDVPIAAQEDIADACVTFLNAIDVYQSDDFRWEEIRVAAIQADGTYVNGASVFTIGTPIAGVGTSIALPVTSAVCCTLRTGGRGPRNRGRFYIPAHVGSLLTTTTGLLISAVQTNVNNWTNALFDTVVAGAVVEPAVVSMTNQTVSTITATAVGDELDNQSRRRRQRPEQYATLPWP